VTDANLSPGGASDQAARETTLTLAAPVTTLRSTAARHDDPDLVHVASAVYDPTQTLAGQWTRMTDDQVMAAGIDPTRLKNDRSGFVAGIYRAESETRTALAFAGTDMTSIKDWTTNLAQGAGLQTQQYAEAVSLAKNVALAFDKAEVIITGHSLGGGLATAAAAATGITAVVFNPAGVHDNTLKREGLDPVQVKATADRGQIRNYIVDGEVLNSVQAWFPIPKPIGQRTTLPDPVPLRPLINWIPGANAVHSLGKHGMAAVAESMAQFVPQHEAFFNGVASKPVGGSTYEGELLSVLTGRSGTVTQQVGDQVVEHDRAKLAGYAGTIKAGATVAIRYNAEATVGVVKQSRTQTRGARIA